MTSDWRRDLAEGIRLSTVHLDAELKQSTTLRVGGTASCLVEVEDEGELQWLDTFAARHGLPFRIMGKGSNLLIGDGGLQGILIRLGRAFREVHAEPASRTATAGAGLANATFVERCRSAGLGGMEFLAAIPGSVGGAIAMNAGAHGAETADFLVSVRYFQRERGIMEKPAGELTFGYRQSPFHSGSGMFVLGGTFALSPASDEEIRAARDRIMQYRRATQPREWPNCGSVFKNPPGQHAARLIQEAGLKGCRVGDAQVSEKHANFILNLGQANAADVQELIRRIRETVLEKTGIGLELEVEVWEDRQE
ncbi:MAG: UDP-N-acetylmuramate dehydrogenase [Deltaproteobacteria bacterium]|nr:UDP-N-acetylmuramate dehydrogenase [Deltaproteobacteria bacterium]